MQFRMTTFEQDIDEENMVRLIDAFVDALDMENLGFEPEITTPMGRPKEFYGSDLLKLMIYGARNQLDSSRDMERACKINVEARWLVHGVTPSYSAISEFRRKNIVALGNNNTRMKYHEELKRCGYKIPILIHYYHDCFRNRSI